MLTMLRSRCRTILNVLILESHVEQKCGSVVLICPYPYIMYFWEKIPPFSLLSERQGVKKCYSFKIPPVGTS